MHYRIVGPKILISEMQRLLYLSQSSMKFLTPFSAEVDHIAQVDVDAELHTP